jgi:hypothetical protein
LCFISCHYAKVSTTMWEVKIALGLALCSSSV